MGNPESPSARYPLLEKPLPESSLPKLRADIDELIAQVNDKIPKAAEAYARLARAALNAQRFLSPFPGGFPPVQGAQEAAVKQVLSYAEEIRKLVVSSLEEAKVVLSMFEDLEEWKLIEGDFEDLARQIKPAVIHPYMKNFGNPGDESRWHGDTPFIYKHRIQEQSPAAVHYALVAEKTAGSLHNLARIGAAYYASWAILGGQVLMVLTHQALSLTRFIPVVGPLLGQIFRQPDYISEARTIARLYVTAETLGSVLTQEVRSETITLRNVLKKDIAIAPYADWPDPTTDRTFPRVNPDGTVSAGATE